MDILFLINTVDSSVATAKSGKIIKVGNSGTVGVGLGEAVAELAGMVIVCVLLQLLFLLIKFSGRFRSECSTGGK